MLRGLIVDDHPVVLRGLREVLVEGIPGVVVDDASGGYEALRKIRANKYDFVVLDISLSDINGLEVIREIRKHRTRLPVLVISFYSEEHYALRALKAGANGYLTKRSACDELLAAVKKILAGRRYLSPTYAEKIVLDFEAEGGKDHHDQLSGRELQVISLIGEGKSTGEIADILGIGVNTARTYRARILKRLGLRGTPQLVRYAIEHRLV